MLFSVNQASHLYVVNNVVTGTNKVTNVGDIKVNSDGDNIYFTYMGKGGVLRSDLVSIKDIIDIRAIEASKQDTKFRTATITLNTAVSSTPVVSQDYIVRIKYSVGSIDNQYLKYGIVRASSLTSTAEKLYEALAESINKNFAREENPAFVATSSASGLVITETEPKWVLGTYPQRPVEFEITVDTITKKDTTTGTFIEGAWGTIDYGFGTVKVNGTNVASYPNSKKIADLEWFCMGERGDQYKNYGWPNIIPTEYMVNANSANGYDVINIHYAYVGANESVQKSEKDMIFVGESTASTVAGKAIRDLAAAINGIIENAINTTKDLPSA